MTPLEAATKTVQCIHDKFVVVVAQSRLEHDDNDKQGYEIYQQCYGRKWNFTFLIRF